MNLTDLPPEVQMLSTLGYSANSAEWTDYQKLGIGPQHFPALVEISRNAPDFWREDASDGEFFTPLHSWRALVQLQAPQAIEQLLHALQWVDDERNDGLILEVFPSIFARIEPSSTGSMFEYLLDSQNNDLARICVGEGLTLIAEEHPELKDEAIRAYRTALERYEEEDVDFTSHIISFLSRLHAVEAAPLVEQVYKVDRVDEFIAGDWEDFQVDVGLIEKKPESTFRPAPFSGLFPSSLTRDEVHITTPYPEFGELSPEEQEKWKELDKKRKKKEKSKLKEAKSARKKHKKKK